MCIPSPAKPSASCLCSLGRWLGNNCMFIHKLVPCSTAPVSDAVSDPSSEVGIPYVALWKLPLHFQTQSSSFLECTGWFPFFLPLLAHWFSVHPLLLPIYSLSPSCRPREQMPVSEDLKTESLLFLGLGCCQTWATRSVVQVARKVPALLFNRGPGIGESFQLGSYSGSPAARTESLWNHLTLFFGHRIEVVTCVKCPCLLNPLLTVEPGSRTWLSIL